MGSGSNPVAVLVAVVLVLGLSLAQDTFSNANTRPPHLKKTSKRNVYFLEKEDIQLPCIADANPQPIYTWYKNDIKLNITAVGNRDRMTIASGVGSLTINPASKDDTGIYQCVAENTLGKSFSSKWNVRPAKMEHFAKKKTEIETPWLGRSQKLECYAPVSYPPAKISWIIILEGEDIDEDSDDGFNFVSLDDRITSDWDGNLYITNVKMEDKHNGAKYVCMAYNKVLRSYNQGSDKIVNPRGSMSPVPVELMWSSEETVLGLTGKTAKFKCIFSGNPQPSITWRRVSGGKLDSRRMIQDKNGFEFQINKLKFTDAGRYACEGKNSLLGGEGKPKFFDLKVDAKPTWKNEPKSVIVGVEENAVFSCEADGRPEPTIEWYINGNPLNNVPDNPRRKLNGKKLEFKNLIKSDSQVIQCNATNKHGSIWADVYLHVLAIPAQVQKKPLELLKVAEGQSVTITCEVTGKPMPTVTWRKGDQQLSGSRYKILRSGNLVIKDVTDNDSGNYKCYASNKFGKDTANGTLVVRDKTVISEEPVDLLLVHGNDATFTCGATTDTHEELRYIWYRDDEVISPDEEGVVMSDGLLTILDISSDDTADYVCMATNGLDNATATAKLEVEAPPEPPFDLELVYCYAERAKIGWKFVKGQENFADVENFIVEYNTSFSKGKWLVATRPPADARSAEISLSLWMKYNFRVRAVNRIGKGEPSEISTPECETPAGRPDNHPRKVATVGDKTNYLVIEWEPMPERDHNGPDFAYNITVKEKNGGKVMNFIETDYTVGRKEIMVNKVYAPYEITVRAQNEQGQPIVKAKVIDGYSGEAAPTVVPKNFELDPDRNVTATSAGFRWDPVDTSEQAMQGEFKGYKVRFWKLDQKDSTMHEVFIPDTKRSRRQAMGGQKMRAEVRDLPSYSEIEADVVAVNNYFSSMGSNIVNFSTPEGVPSAVEYLRALYRGSTHFLLEWGEPTEPNGNVTGYRVGYRIINGLDIGPLEGKVDVNRNRMFLGNLTPDKLYRVFVWGLTKEGQGEEYFIDVRTAELNTALAQPLIDDVRAGLTSVNVTWSLPDISGIRVGSHYFLEFREMGQSKWKRVPEEENENFWQQIEGLEEATTYQVRVAAKTDNPDNAPISTTNSSPRTFTTTGVAAKRANVFSAGWFIGMMVAIAILLLILIIVCIIKRNRGDKYHVQEKERLRGSNPDDPHDHFNEYAKSDENGVGQSNSFENNPEKMPLEYDETDSMEDYGDVDPGKFNEDGSFIGQYGVQKSSEAANASAMSTLV